MIYRSKKKGGFDAMIRKARTAYKYCIGIDTGTHTGVAVWNREERRFEILAEMKIHKAMFIVSEYAKVAGDKVLVRVEDARKRNKYGDRSEFKLQGAGSVKRDSTIWEDYLKDLKIDIWSLHKIIILNWIVKRLLNLLGTVVEQTSIIEMRVCLFLVYNKLLSFFGIKSVNYSHAFFIPLCSNANCTNVFEYGTKKNPVA